MTGPASWNRAVFGVFAVAAFVVLLWGGYVEHWSWTGFSDNDTLWDWLGLLLLPIAFATIPIWLRSRERIGPRRRLVLGACLAAFAVLVVVGYVVPLVWTGFIGNTLWDWISLVVLPVTVAATAVWREGRRRQGPRWRLVLAVAILAFAVTVAGGYLGGWAWTGFRGNTLWDWLQLLLVPLVFPTVLLPAAEAWVTAAEEPDASGRPQFVLAAFGVLAAGGAIACVALADHPPERHPAAARVARAGCAPAHATTVRADGRTRVLRAGGTVFVCGDDGRRVTLGRGRDTSHFRLTATRVVFAEDECSGDGDCVSEVKVFRIGSSKPPFVRERLQRTGGVADLAVAPSGGLAIMVRGTCTAVDGCAPPRLHLLGPGGSRVAAAGPALDLHSLAAHGTTVYWRDGGRAASAQL